IIEDGTYDKVVDERYAGWNAGLGKDILGGKLSLDDLASKVESEGINPQPRSGQQEYLENLINRFV
ncbi:MAG TPA: xylose isomerase, partial [Devosia sp.]